MLQTTIAATTISMRNHAPARRCKQISIGLHAHQFLSTEKLLLLLMLLLFHLTHTAIATVAAGSHSNDINVIATAAATTRECESMDIRNECDSFLQLQGCTVIKGFLTISLLPKLINYTIETCDYTKYTFPKLREITDYLIFYDVKGLTTIREMFPSLTVIRGKRLFLNYALGISTMPDIELIEFKSLIAIQRGHVYVGSCPRLCHLEKINWDRLTLAPGENHIFPIESNTCKAQSCPGCPNPEYCWSLGTCQKFENDNVIDLRQGSLHCHPQCLGGCYNKTKEGCVVCRKLTDHDACVAECPRDKYLHEHYQRCYTKEECTHKYGLYIHDSNCVTECPADFIVDKNTSSCIPCPKNQTCIKECPQGDFFTIYNLADADHLRGCQFLNGSLIITIRNKVNEADLKRSLESLQEISGHLKISRSPHLSSLVFLENLKKISGKPLENDLYAIIIYDNNNLKHLWNGKNLKLLHGSMYIHLNDKLCNRYLMEFRNDVKHDLSKNSLQVNDQEVLCDPATIPLKVEAISSDTLSFTWRKEQTSDEVEILYRPISPNENFIEDSELDSNVCQRIKWQRQLVIKSELLRYGNETHFIINITGLKQFTQYACLLKTFGGANEAQNARSMIELACTKADKPTPPLLTATNATETSLAIQLVPQNTSWELVNYYTLKVYYLPYDLRLLDKRNFCNQPPRIYYLDIPTKAYASNEDYDDCCARQEEANEDRHFMRSMREKYACSSSAAINCIDAVTQQEIVKQRRPIQDLRLKTSDTHFVLTALKRYSPYTLQLWACNNEVGCGSYTLLSVHTNYSMDADNLQNLHACRVPATTEYHISFAEPKQPNGAIVSYVIHFRNYLPDAKADPSHLRCVTRQQHQDANYRYVSKLNATYNRVAVRVHSLAGDIFTEWVNVSQCYGVVTTKIAGIDGESHGVNIFLICFLLGAGGTLLWICYKRRYWRMVPECRRRYLPLDWDWRRAVVRHNNATAEDRQTLVDDFETVRFHNSPDDDFY